MYFLLFFWTQSSNNVCLESNSTRMTTKRDLILSFDVFMLNNAFVIYIYDIWKITPKLSNLKDNLHNYIEKGTSFGSNIDIPMNLIFSMNSMGRTGIAKPFKSPVSHTVEVVFTKGWHTYQFYSTYIPEKG